MHTFTRSAALLVAGFVMAGCAHAHQGTSSSATTSARPAVPVTFTHRTPTPTPIPTPTPHRPSSTRLTRLTSPVGSTTSTSPASAPVDSSSSSSSSSGNWTEPSGADANLGGPTNAHEITDPVYDFDHIDRTSAAQVAWAYLVSLMSYSYTDPGPGAGIARAATYAVPVHHPVVQTTGSVSAPSAWAKVVAMQMVSRAAVTQLTAYVPAASGTKASVHLAWMSVLTQKDGASQQTSGQTTVLEVRQPGGKWLVADNGFGVPN